MIPNKLTTQLPITNEIIYLITGIGGAVIGFVIRPFIDDWIKRRNQRISSEEIRKQYLAPLNHYTFLLYDRFTLDSDALLNDIVISMGGMLIYRRIFEKEDVYKSIRRYNKKLADVLNEKLNGTCQLVFVKGEFEAEHRDQLRMHLEGYLEKGEAGVRWLDEKRLKSAKENLPDYAIVRVFKKMDDNSFDEIRKNLWNIHELIEAS